MNEVYKESEDPEILKDIEKKKISIDWMNIDVCNSWGEFDPKVPQDKIVLAAKRDTFVHWDFGVIDQLQNTESKLQYLELDQKLRGLVLEQALDKGLLLSKLSPKDAIRIAVDIVNREITYDYKLSNLMRKDDSTIKEEMHAKKKLDISLYDLLFKKNGWICLNYSNAVKAVFDKIKSFQRSPSCLDNVYCIETLGGNHIRNSFYCFSDKKNCQMISIDPTWIDATIEQELLNRTTKKVKNKADIIKAEDKLYKYFTLNGTRNTNDRSLLQLYQNWLMNAREAVKLCNDLNLKSEAPFGLESPFAVEIADVKKILDEFDMLKKYNENDKNEKIISLVTRMDRPRILTKFSPDDMNYIIDNRSDILDKETIDTVLMYKHSVELRK